MKCFALLLALVAVVGCDRAPPPKAGEVLLPTDKVRCIEFDRPTTRKGERWTCRVLFCDYGYREEGGPTTLWCDKE